MGRLFPRHLSSLVAEPGGVGSWEYGVRENVGLIDTIGVDPDHRKSGIAGRLFREMAGNRKEAGVDTIYTFVTQRGWRGKEDAWSRESRPTRHTTRCAT